MSPIGTAGTCGITAAMPQRVFLSHTSDLGKPAEAGSFLAAAVAAVLRACQRPRRPCAGRATEDGREDPNCPPIAHPRCSPSRPPTTHARRRRERTALLHLGTSRLAARTASELSCRQLWDLAQQRLSSLAW
jgi:hypothetical protein